MANCILWTFGVYEELLTKGENLLSNRQKKLLEMKLKDDLSISQLAAKLNVSEPTIHRDIAKIKKVYSYIQKTSDIMPPLFKNNAEMQEYIKTK